MWRWGLVVFACVALAGCGSDETATDSATTPSPTGHAHAEAAFRHAVEGVARGGVIRVGRPGTVETSCDGQAGQWNCQGWFVSEGRAYCISVAANVAGTGQVGKETYGKIPIGEPGGFECKP